MTMSSNTYEQAVDELQKRVDMLHVLAGIEVSPAATGFAIGMMQSATAALDSASDHIVESSGMTEAEWFAYREAESERERLATQREKSRAQRERRKERG
jgi:hypothetical protein